MSPANPPTQRRIIVPIVLVLTAAHVAFRLSSEVEAQPMLVSTLEPGEMVSDPLLTDLTADLPAGSCLPVVAFNPDCPFCKQAADRERETLTEESRSARVWFTDEAWNTLPDFLSDHLAREVEISAELFETLHVHAVPALFLVDGKGELRWVGAYYGDESEEVLASRCFG
jgi:thioredoxin-related protein